MREVMKKITQFTKEFITNPVLLLGGMALFVAIKVLASPDRKK